MSFKPYISFHDVCYSYEGKANALKNISFNISQNSVHALVGPNGAGKTTLMKLVNGSFTDYIGDIRYDEELLKGNQIDKSRFANLIDNPGFYWKLSVNEYLEFCGKFFGDKYDSKYQKYLMELLQIGDLKLKNLSLGMKQKIHIIRCLMIKPKVLLLDEPTSNLDLISCEKIWEEIHNLVEDKRSSVLISSHQLDDLEKVATEFSFIKEGKIIEHHSKDHAKDKVCRSEISFSHNEEINVLFNSALKEHLNPEFYPDRIIYDDVGDNTNSILKILLNHDIRIQGVGPAQNSLKSKYKEYFHENT